MALLNFVDMVGPAVPASYLNELDRIRQSLSADITGKQFIAAPVSGNSLSIASSGNGGVGLEITGLTGRPVGLYLAQAGATAWNIYQPGGSNTLNLRSSTYGGDTVSFLSTGGISILGATVGIAFNVTGLANGEIARFNSVSGSSKISLARAGAVLGYWGSGDAILSGANGDLGLTSTSGALLLGTNSITRVTISNAGDVAVANALSAKGINIPQHAFARVTAATGAVTGAQGVAFTSHTGGTGIYVFALTGFTAAPVVEATCSNSTSGICLISSLSASSVQITTLTDAGVPADRDFHLIAVGV